jgi:hypothetical protein
MDEERFNTCPASPPQRLISLKNWRELSDAEFQLLVNLLPSALPHPNSHPLGAVVVPFRLLPLLCSFRIKPFAPSFSSLLCPYRNHLTHHPRCCQLLKVCCLQPWPCSHRPQARRLLTRCQAQRRANCASAAVAPSVSRCDARARAGEAAKERGGKPACNCVAG